MKNEGDSFPQYPGGGFQDDYLNKPAKSRMDFFSLLRLFARRWIVVVLMAGCGGLSGLLYFKLVAPTYEARADLEMRVRRPKVINSEAIFEDQGNGGDADAIFNTRFAKFRSPAMEQLATEEFYRLYPEEKKNGISNYLLAKRIGEVKWSKSSKADIVQVRYYDHDPVFAARLVNVLSDCAGVLMMRENQAMSDEAVKWLISQVNEQRESLEEVEAKLAGIRDEVQVDSLEQRKEALGKALISVSEEREELISTLNSRTTAYEYISDWQGMDKNLEVLPAGLPREEQLNDLIRTWRNAYDELQVTANRYTEIHPNYRAAAELEERARKRLEQFVDLATQSVENEIQLLKRQVEQTEARIEEMKAESISLERKLVVGRQRLQRLERERDAADNAYQSVLRRMEEARLSADENMAYTKVIQKAVEFSAPVSPKLPRSLALGIVAGGFLGCLIALLMEYSADRVASVNELREMGLNILCSVPRQKRGGSREQLASIGLRNKFSSMVETFAEMNALISSNRYTDHCRVMVFTSILSGEGKTVSSCNLAISSAFNGSKTLLIDCDMRRPQIMNIFGIREEHPSLLEWLNDSENKMTHEELVSRDTIENLDVIITRPLTETNPAELLGRDRLAQLIKWGRDHYDRVIIDSPPLGPVSDALVMANQADGVVLVSRIGRTRRRSLRFALNRFESTGIPVLGCIANDVQNSLTGMFSGGEGYGAGYGYSSYKS